MDTRFWGPSAWVLLHTIAYNYEPSEINRKQYRLFFENLKNVLPCIYCRASYTEYFEKIPIDRYLDNSKDLSYWMYQIHNLVNDKLRGQGLISWRDPSFDEIYERYTAMNYGLDLCKARDQSIMAWKFLYCVAFVYAELGKDVAQTSHYNGYYVFFNILGDVLPKKGNYNTIYSNFLVANPVLPNLDSRERLKNWLYNLEKSMDNQQNIQCQSFNDIEKEIEMYRAGCGGIQKDLKPTCRRLRK